MTMNDSSSKVCFADYDVLGFDMDYTLARYQCVPFFNMVYDGLRSYLTKEKGYDPSLFHNLHEDKDLICKGLFADFETGNVLKLSCDGVIMRATHGTRRLSTAEIEDTYGKCRTFSDFEIFKRGLKSPDSKWRLFENFFDLPGLVAYARIIDSIPGTDGKNMYYQPWADVLSGLEDLYYPSQFSENKSFFFNNMKEDVRKYIDKLSQQVLNWMMTLKQNGRKVFLLTSSHADFANLVMDAIIGSEWKSYFDFIGYGARKPRFFTESKPFRVVGKNFEMGEEAKKLMVGGEYSQGNCADLMTFFTEITGKAEPKVMYFGDSICSDAWPSKTKSTWDNVLILEEMDAEGYAVTDGSVPGHEDDMEDSDVPHKKRKRNFEHSSLVTMEEIELMVSDFWGAVFIDSEHQIAAKEKLMNTAIGFMISQYSDICVPSIEYLAGLPVDHVFTTFSSVPGNLRGFHPGCPASLVS